MRRFLWRAGCVSFPVPLRFRVRPHRIIIDFHVAYVILALTAEKHSYFVLIDVKVSAGTHETEKADRLSEGRNVFANT